MVFGDSNVRADGQVLADLPMNFGLEAAVRLLEITLSVPELVFYRAVEALQAYAVFNEILNIFLPVINAVGRKFIPIYRAHWLENVHEYRLNIMHQATHLHSEDADPVVQVSPHLFILLGG